MAGHWQGVSQQEQFGHTQSSGVTASSVKKVRRTSRRGRAFDGVLLGPHGPRHTWAEWATLSVGASQVAPNARSELPE